MHIMFYLWCIDYDVILKTQSYVFKYPCNVFNVCDNIC